MKLYCNMSTWCLPLAIGHDSGTWIIGIGPFYIMFNGEWW